MPPRRGVILARRQVLDRDPQTDAESLRIEIRWPEFRDEPSRDLPRSRLVDVRIDSTSLIDAGQR
jgi:hypothetical protein